MKTLNTSTPAPSAKCVLASYPGHTRVHELYDIDIQFATALIEFVGPDFEYPDFSHKTVADILRSTH